MFLVMLSGSICNYSGCTLKAVSIWHFHLFHVLINKINYSLKQGVILFVIILSL